MQESIRAVGKCRYLGLVLTIITGLLPASCGTDNNPPAAPPVRPNRPPVIIRLYQNPDRVLRNHRISVVAVTQDPDRDLLGHIWTSDRGTFPAGYGFSIVTWLSPEEPGPSTLYLSVTDREFTVSDSMIVETSELDPPTGMTFVLGPSVADLYWERSPDENIDHWKGYEISMTPSPINSIPEEERHLHRLALLEGGNRQFRRGGLSRGTLYYFSVSSVRGWGAWIESEGRWETEERSGPGPEVVLSPRPEWNAFTTELAHPGGSFALDLSAGTVHPIDVYNPSEVSDRDLYFGTSDPMDGRGPVWMKSVSLLANRNEAWSDRVVRFKLLGYDWSVNTTTGDGWMEQVPVERDLVYAVLLPEGNYAKIQITGVEGGHPYRQIQLRWAYQTIPDFPAF